MTPERLRDLIATVRRNKSPFLVGLLADAFEELGRNDFGDRERAADLRSALAEREALAAFSLQRWLYVNTRTPKVLGVYYDKYELEFEIEDLGMWFLLECDYASFQSFKFSTSFGYFATLDLPESFEQFSYEGTAYTFWSYAAEYFTPFWQQFVTDEFEYAVRRTLLKVRDTAPLHDTPADEFPLG
jgi:hypothetical protein